MGGMRQAVGDPDLHEGLTAYAKVRGFLIDAFGFTLGCSALDMSAKGITLPPSSKYSSKSFAFIGSYLMD